MGTGCRPSSWVWPVVGGIKPRRGPVAPLHGYGPLALRQRTQARIWAAACHGDRTAGPTDPGSWPRCLYGRVLVLLAPRTSSGFSKTCPVPKYPLSECDGPGMTSHVWCTGHVAGCANLHSNGRVLPFGVGTVGNSIGSANLCGLDLFHVRSGQSWWPSYKMDLGLLPFCERPNAH